VPEGRDALLRAHAAHYAALVRWAMAVELSCGIEPPAALNDDLPEEGSW
jgi:hypothetical protein